MTTETTTFATIKQYLPATLGPSALTSRLEQRLSAPFRRTYDIWLPSE